MIHKVKDGRYVISSGGSWLPGVYEDEATARYAFQFSDAALHHLQEIANGASDPTQRYVRMCDLKRARSNQQLSESEKQ